MARLDISTDDLIKIRYMALQLAQGMAAQGLGKMTDLAKDYEEFMLRDDRTTNKLSAICCAEGEPNTEKD